MISISVNAGLGAERAVGPVTLNINGAVLDTGDVARGFARELHAEALAFRVFQIHALKHRGPVLGFRAACARLNFKVAVRRIHRIIEHALELKLLNLLFDRLHVFTDARDRIPVFFLAAHLEEFARVADAGFKLAVGSDRILKELFLLGHLFGMLRVIPEIGVLDLAVQFFKTSGFEVDVKDTP